jgi:hypothetical protein
VLRSSTAIGLVCVLLQVARADEPAPAEDPSSETEAAPPAPAEETSAPVESAPAPAPAPPPPAEEPEAEDQEAGIGPIGGETFAYVRAPLERGALQQVSASLWLRARPRMTEATSSTIELAVDRIEVGPTSSRRFRFALREAYVSLHKSGWLLRAGQQVIPWGSSDVVNPTDFLTAHDYSFYAVETEKTRTGAISVLVSHAWPHVEMTVVATPIPPSTVLLLPPNTLPMGITLVEPVPFDTKLENSEVAAKMKVSGRKWDLAFVGFRGFNHTPEFELVAADDNGAVVRQNHHGIIAGGFDGSASVGRLVARIEGSVVRTKNDDGADPSIQPTYAFGVFGLERPLGDRVRVQAQAIARTYPRWSAPATASGPDPATTRALQGVAAANALILDYQDRVRTSATLRVAYLSAEERWAAEVFGAVNFIGRDFLVRPLVGWHPTEAVAIQLGADIYGGPKTRPLGAMHPFGGVFLQTSFAF